MSPWKFSWCLQAIDHPNVLTLHDVVDTAEKLFIVLDVALGGDFFEVTATADCAETHTASRVAVVVACANTLAQSASLHQIAVVECSDC